MQFDTRALGNIEIETANQFFFPEGIFAFENFKHFAVLPTKEGSTFYWLQSLEDAKLAFLVTLVSDILSAYDPSIPQAYLSSIEATSYEEVETWGIITVPQGKPELMTINLQGPILINRTKKLGGQFVSEDPAHTVRATLLDLVEKNSKGESRTGG